MDRIKKTISGVSPMWVLFTSLVVFILSSCGNSGDDLECLTEIEFEPVLTNIADELILPSYERFGEDLAQLDSALVNFTLTPDEDRLEDLRQAFLSAYISLVQCEQYEFGPAEAVAFRAVSNNFPLNLSQLEENVNSGAYDIDDITRYDKGFPALDYVFFGTGSTPSETVDFLSSNAAYLEYAGAILADLDTRVTFMLNEWRASYRNGFINNTGTQAGSSMSQLLNALNQNFEITKRDRLGIPSGVLTLDFPNPDKVEAPYSGISLELASESVRSSIDLYLGRSPSGSNGQGFDDILINIEAMKDGRSLDEVIQEQYDLILSAIDNIDGTLAEAVDNDSDDVIAAYAETSRQVIHTKTDMSSVMCISITYVDAPSDTD